MNNKAISGRFWMFLLCILPFCLPACQNGGDGKHSGGLPLSNYDSVALGKPEILFDTLAYDFGRVYEGEKVGWYFRFTNTGSGTLVINNVSASCGCTVPEYNNEPVTPGSHGEIKVVFDTDGRSGYQYKTVSVESNGTPESVELVITAEVLKK